MRKLFLVPILCFTLIGCGPLGSFVSTVSTAVTTPVAPVDIYRVKNVYAASLELVVEYRNYCWSKPYAALMVDTVAKALCENRRATVRIMQASKNKASLAIKNAVAAPTLLSAAWDAVQAFRSTIPAVK